MYYETGEILQAVFDRGCAPHRLVARPALLARLADAMKGIDELTLVATPARLTVQSFHPVGDTVAVSGALHTSMLVRAEELEVYHVVPPAGTRADGGDDLVPVCNVTFGLKEFRAILAFAEDRAVGADEVTLMFRDYGFPVSLSTAAATYSAELVLATLERSPVPEPAPLPLPPVHLPAPAAAEPPPPPSQHAVPPHLPPPPPAAAESAAPGRTAAAQVACAMSMAAGSAAAAAGYKRGRGAEYEAAGDDGGGGGEAAMAGDATAARRTGGRMLPQYSIVSAGSRGGGGGVADRGASIASVPRHPAAAAASARPRAAGGAGAAPAPAHAPSPAHAPLDASQIALERGEHLFAPPPDAPGGRHAPAHCVSITSGGGASR